jgi:hypothetical protein
MVAEDAFVDLLHARYLAGLAQRRGRQAQAQAQAQAAAAAAAAQAAGSASS